MWSLLTRRSVKITSHRKVFVIVITRRCYRFHAPCVLWTQEVCVVKQGIRRELKTNGLRWYRLMAILPLRYYGKGNVGRQFMCSIINQWLSNDFAIGMWTTIPNLLIYDNFYHNNYFFLNLQFWLESHRLSLNCFVAHGSLSIVSFYLTLAALHLC